MPVFMLRAVRKSADGCKSAHVASMWPYQAPDLTEAKRFVDRTPDIGWSDADTFEVADERGCALSCRPIDCGSEERLQAWVDEEAEEQD